MKLWYQSFTREAGFEGYGQLARAALSAAAEAETTVEFHGIVRGQGVFDEYRAIEQQDRGEIIENAFRAEAAGYDAFLIGNIIDPGLAESRELTNFPVLGLCETSLHVACLMGRRFGIVAANQKLMVRVAENVAYAGLTARMASLRSLGSREVGALGTGVASETGRSAIVDDFVREAEICVRDGAEVLIPGGGIVMAALTAEKVRAVAEIPVLDGMAALVKVGEAAVGLSRLTGGFTSKALTHAGPTGPALDVARQLYLR